MPVLLLAGGILVSSQAPPKRRTVWDGVYTEAQATRATGIFGSTCAGCHTLTPEGNRPLSGDNVLAKQYPEVGRRTPGLRQQEHAERQRRLARRRKATTTSWR